MLWLMAWAVGVAAAADPASIASRLTEIDSVRSLRAAEGVPTIPTSAYLSIQSGGVETGIVSVEGHAAKKAWGVTVVDAPIDRLWAAINDDSGQVAYNKLDSSEIVSGTRCSSGRGVLQLLPVPWVTDRWWITFITENAAISSATSGRVRENTWQSNNDVALVTTASGQAAMDAGLPIEFTKGAWFMADIDGSSTLIEYYVWTDPGGSVPAGLASRMAAGGIEDTFEAVTKFANEGQPGCL